METVDKYMETMMSVMKRTMTRLRSINRTMTGMKIGMMAKSLISMTTRTTLLQGPTRSMNPFLPDSKVLRMCQRAGALCTVRRHMRVISTHSTGLTATTSGGKKNSSYGKPVELTQLPTRPKNDGWTNVAYAMTDSLLSPTCFRCNSLIFLRIL